MPTVKFVNEKKTVEVEEGANLRLEAMKAGVQVYSGVEKVLNCHGLGVCTNCQVRIRKGAENVSKQGFWEKMNMLNAVLHPFTFFARVGQEETLRLACQTKVYGDVEVETNPPLNWHGEKFWA